MQTVQAVNQYVRDCVVTMRAGTIKAAAMQRSKAYGALELAHKLGLISHEMDLSGMGLVTAEYGAVNLRNSPDHQERFAQAIRMGVEFDALCFGGDL